MKNKITFLVLWMILLASTCLAADLSVSIIQYNSDTEQAWVKIENTGKDVRNITVQLDSSKPRFVVGLLRSGNSISIHQVVSQGNHNLTLTTADGSLIFKKMYYPVSRPNLATPAEDNQKSRISILVSIPFIIVLAIIFVIVFLIIRFAKNKKEESRPTYLQTNQQQYRPPIQQMQNSQQMKQPQNQQQQKDPWDQLRRIGGKP